MHHVFDAMLGEHLCISPSPPILIPDIRTLCSSTMRLVFSLATDDGYFTLSVEFEETEMCTLNIQRPNRVFSSPCFPWRENAFHSQE